MDYVNWFANDGLPNFTRFLAPLQGKPIKALQIGSYTGDASVWLVDNVLTHPDSVLVDIDTWEGSDEPVHHEMNWKTVEELYDQKTESARNQNKIVKYKGTSESFFLQNTMKFDFIYVDGDHTSYGVIKDAVSSYECLKVDGIIAFDDYQWSAGLGPLKEPKLAIDAFNNIYLDRLELLLRDYQCWYRKIQ